MASEATRRFLSPLGQFHQPAPVVHDHPVMEVIDVVIFQHRAP